MFQLVGEHSIALKELPRSGANILDLGCRGFDFRNYFNKKHNVYCVDIDELDDNDYYKVALSDTDGLAGIIRDGQATRITQGAELRKLTLESFSRLVKVSRWDIIKFDIEGEEFNILSKTKHPIAQQVSIEFHAHYGVQTKEMLDELLKKLSAFYEIYNQVWESRHYAGFNYWDVLLIAK